MVISLKNTIIGTILPNLPAMTFKPVRYQFHYEGSFESLDSIPILTAHLNFINLLIEIKNKVSPDSKLNVDLKGLKEGSLEFQHIVDIAIPVGMFAINNYDTIKNVISIFSDVLKLKAAAGGEKITYNDVGNNKIEVHVYVNGDNNKVTIDKEALNLYQGVPAISKLMAETANNIKKLEEVESLEIIPENKKLPSIKLDRNEIMMLSEPNPYLEDDEDFAIYENAVLYVRKPDLAPKKGKKCVWQLNHNSRDISATIVDESFIENHINKGDPFGQGYRLVADLKAYKKFDKALGISIENKKYDVIAVHKVLPRPEQSSLDLK